MRYAKDTIIAIALALSVPVLLISFFVAAFILICRRLYWGLQRRFEEPVTNPWTWGWLSKSAADADSAAERMGTAREHDTIPLAEASDVEPWPGFSAERRRSVR